MGCAVKELDWELKRPSKKLNVVSIDDTLGGTAPRSKEHLALYCAFVLGVKVPDPAVCAGHKSPLDALWDAYADESFYQIWHAMRGSGKTLLLAILAWLESVFKPFCGTTILGGSLEQSQKAIAYSTQLWQRPNVPRQLLIGDVAGRGYRLKNGSWVQALAASQKSVRGPHPQKLRLDEVDEMAREIYDAALGQPKANFGIPDQVVASSTLHHPFGMMSELIDKREERGAELYQWCVEEVKEPSGFWSEEEIERKHKLVTNEMWDAEFLLKRPTIGESIYDFEAVERAYQRGKGVHFEKRGRIEAGIDWGHTATVLHLIQDVKEKYICPETYRWEFVELTERCQQIADLCIEKGITNIYADIAPKDSNITLHKILRKNQAPTRLQSVAFSKWICKSIITRM
ncbi:MAG TPA: hypothetical protein VMX17_04355 [Candidatus Glassbacteria bacterium]|nr:hypothetical protein [Candidatus Glassbacteria bacterium]